MAQFDPKTQLLTLPTGPGVYRMIDADGALLYVGKAKNLKKRVSSYFEGRGHGPRIHRMVEKIALIDITLTGNESEALILEQRLIQKEKPKYNILFRDDKTYGYIKISGHPSPQISLYRGKRDLKSKFFGPYTDNRLARETMEFAQKTFKLRTCADSVYSNRARACILHQIGRCSAPCVNEISPSDYQLSAVRAASFLKGEDKELIAQLTSDMEKASEEMQFERAAAMRDQIRGISAARAGQSIEGAADKNVDIIALASETQQGCAQVMQIRAGVVSGSLSFRFNSDGDADEEIDSFCSGFYSDKPMPARVICNLSLTPETKSALEQKENRAVEWVIAPVGQEFKWLDQALLNAKASLAQKVGKQALAHSRQRALEREVGMEGLDHIECFDISHFQAEEAVASCVVYKDGVMRNDLYRIFNMSAESAGDDFASMKEALIRRYQGMDPQDLPNLLLIDGGAGQLSKAREALELLAVDIPMLGVAKGVERKAGAEELVPSWDRPPFHPGKESAALLLIQTIRDEAHRFAITRNRKKVGKKRGESHLLAIPGVGPSKRKALLLAFGSAKRVAEASESELIKVPGVSVALARSIREALSSSGDGAGA